MKNKKYNDKKLINKAILCLLIILASTVACYAEPVAAGSALIPMKTVLIKFGITMGAVLASLLVIWSVLYTFKRYTAVSLQEYKQQSLYGDNFKSSPTLDKAIISFIEKNKL